MKLKITLSAEIPEKVVQTVMVGAECKNIDEVIGIFKGQILAELVKAIENEDTLENPSIEVVPIE